MDVGKTRLEKGFGGVALAAALSALFFPIPASAQATGEFKRDFYNAHRCMRVEEVNRGGTRTIMAQNLCDAQVAALVCFRVLKESRSIGATGWHCDYSDLYGPKTERAASQGGVYHPTLKVAACAKSKSTCVQFLRSIQAKVRGSRGDPEPIARDLRRQFGI